MSCCAECGLLLTIAKNSFRRLLATVNYTSHMRSQLLMVGALALCAGCGGGTGAASSSAVVIADASAPSVQIVQGTTLQQDVRVNRPGIGAASVSVLVAPRHGTASVDDDQRVRYSPDADFIGSDSLVYRMAPEGGAATTGTLMITVYQSMTAGAPSVLLPETGLVARNLAVLVNDSDPQSIAVAAYYVRKRHIPAANVIHLNFPAGSDSMTSAAFAALKTQVDAAAGSAIQALALTWTRPYRVDGMSITSAFALGFDTAYENQTGGCASTKMSPYYNSGSTAPFTDLGVRPAMMLAGVDAAAVYAVIDRGVAADWTFPSGTGYLLRTSDTSRSVRWSSMTTALAEWNHAPDGLRLVYVDNSAGTATDSLQGKGDVLLYMTGLVSVPDIVTNMFRPGAAADHLTSGGGVLSGSSAQMSALRWLEGGATASYGAVAEPCNYTTKFPDPAVLLDQYYRGATLLEAYWKSVAWPGEGVFIGEPLARPFGRSTLTYDATHTLTLRTTALVPGKAYDLQAADTSSGPFVTVLGGFKIPFHKMATITLPGATRASYRLIGRTN